MENDLHPDSEGSESQLRHCCLGNVPKSPPASTRPSRWVLALWRRPQSPPPSSRRWSPSLWFADLLSAVYVTDHRCTLPFRGPGLKSPWAGEAEQAFNTSFGRQPAWSPPFPLLLLEVRQSDEGWVAVLWQTGPVLDITGISNGLGPPELSGHALKNVWSA